MSATVAGPAENGPKPAFRASLAGLVSATLADIGSGSRLPPPIFSSESKLKAIQPLVLRPLFSGEKGVVKGVYRSFPVVQLARPIWPLIIKIFQQSPASSKQPKTPVLAFIY